MSIINKWKNIEWVNWQMCQCRLHIKVKKTFEYYENASKITANCSCKECLFYENVVVNIENQLLEILKDMNVDLTKQYEKPHEKIKFVSDSKENKIRYLSSYFVFGKIGKTQLKNKKVDTDNNVYEVSYNYQGIRNNIQVIIKQVEEEKLSFELYIVMDPLV